MPWNVSHKRFLRANLGSGSGIGKGVPGSKDAEAE